MNKFPSFTKTCSNCGLEKPLSAFLKFGGTQEGIYGSICSTCRKTLKDKEASQDSDDGTKIKHDYKIDTKVKVAEDIDKKEKFKKVEEEYHKERDVDEEQEVKKEEKKQTVAKDEKKHREEFIKPKEKTSIFDNRENRRAQGQSAGVLPDEKVFGGQQQVAEESTVRLDETIDMRAKFTHSTNFQYLKSWLGADARLVHQAERSKILDAKKRTEKGAAPKESESISESLNRTFGKK
jgi:hypothetical protein